MPRNSSVTVYLSSAVVDQEGWLQPPMAKVWPSHLYTWISYFIYFLSFGHFIKFNIKWLQMHIYTVLIKSGCLQNKKMLLCVILITSNWILKMREIWNSSCKFEYFEISKKENWKAQLKNINLLLCSVNTSRFNLTVCVPPACGSETECLWEGSQPAAASSWAHSVLIGPSWSARPLSHCSTHKNICKLCRKQKGLKDWWNNANWWITSLYPRAGADSGSSSSFTNTSHHLLNWHLQKAKKHSSGHSTKLKSVATFRFACIRVIPTCICWGSMMLTGRLKVPSIT